MSILNWQYRKADSKIHGFQKQVEISHYHNKLIKKLFSFIFLIIRTLIPYTSPNTTMLYNFSNPTNDNIPTTFFLCKSCWCFTPQLAQLFSKRGFCATILSLGAMTCQFNFCLVHTSRDELKGLKCPEELRLLTKWKHHVSNFKVLPLKPFLSRGVSVIV